MALMSGIFVTHFLSLRFVVFYLVITGNLILIMLFDQQTLS